MGVDYSTIMGVGYILPDELSVPEEHEEEYEDDPVYYIEQNLSGFPGIGYMVGGSYYEADNVHIALVINSTTESFSDFAGIKSVVRLKPITGPTADEVEALKRAYQEFTGTYPTALPEYLVAGLWH